MPPLPPRDFPADTTLHPVILPDGTVHKGTVFLKAATNHPNMDIGAFTYASAFDPPSDWAARLAPYLYPGAPERLKIGKFCQIADGVMFLTASANHRYDGISSFPFAVFLDMDRHRPSMPQDFPDTVIGHDVWLGQGARILPGATIGPGCIIGAGAVVGGTIPPYSIVAGSPGKVLRARFDPEHVQRLLAIAWWDWPIERITAAEAEICGGDIDALEDLCTD